MTTNRPQLPQLPELSLPSFITEDATFLALQKALTYTPMSDAQKPKKLEFDKLGRLKKNPNNGFSGGSTLGTYKD